MTYLTRARSIALLCACTVQASALAAAQAPPDATDHATTDSEHDTTAENDAITANDVDALRRALARYRHEPSASLVQEDALRHMRANPQRVADLAARARTAGWLPSARFLARRGQSLDWLAAQTTTTERNSASAANNLVFEASLSFDLARVVWNNQEPRIEREMRAERQAASAVIQLVTSLYFERRKLQLERDLGEGPTIDGELRIEEIEALLDGFTGGAFIRALRRASRSQATRASRDQYVQ